MKDKGTEVKSVGKRKKRRIKVGFRGVILAMLMALLFFLGWDGMNFGQGSGVSTQTEGSAEDSDKSGNEEVSEADGEEAQSFSYAIYVVEDKVYIDPVAEDGKLILVELPDLEKRLKELDTNEGRIVLYDAGALSGTYEDVLELVKQFEFVYREESISLDEDRF